MRDAGSKIKMKTYLDCIPCFFRQALEFSRLSGAGEKVQRRSLDAVAREVPRLSLEASPPEIAGIIHARLRKVTGSEDPYYGIKQKSNVLALSVYDKLKKKVVRARDPLLMAAELAIAGNIIDYGVKGSLNVEAELARILNMESKAIKRERRLLFDYSGFQRTLSKVNTILYLGDNAGETVFDRVLIEEIKNMDNGKKIIYAVKEGPIINDALAEDARFCGIDKLAGIVSAGCAAPGAVLSSCSKEFLRIYKEADMVISKGQGNFEALSCAGRDIFFMFMTKCAIVAREIRSNIGDIVLLHYTPRRCLHCR